MALYVLLTYFFCIFDQITYNESARECIYSFSEKIIFHARHVYWAYATHRELS